MTKTIELKLPTSVQYDHLKEMFEHEYSFRNEIICSAIRQCSFEPNDIDVEVLDAYFDMCDVINKLVQLNVHGNQIPVTDETIGYWRMRLNQYAPVVLNSKPFTNPDLEQFDFVRTYMMTSIHEFTAILNKLEK